MISAIHRLIAALQEELRQYGEMLALLDEQQDQVIDRNVENLLQSIAQVQRQSILLQETRRVREVRQQELATIFHLQRNPALVDLLHRVPQNYRPAIQALIQENQELLYRVHDRARQNHLLLSRSMELMQCFMNSLFAPPGESALYTDPTALAAGPSRPDVSPEICVMEGRTPTNAN